MFTRWITAACRGQGAMVEITNHMGMLASEPICLLLGPVEINALHAVMAGGSSFSGARRDPRIRFITT
jgi:hypothetical protein